jgi:two-component system LytT family response regulator
MIPMYIDYAAASTLKPVSIPTGIRVVILEPDDYNRSKLRALFSGEREFVVVAECKSWLECHYAMQEMLPELLIARGELLPNEWSRTREPSFAFPVVIAVDQFEMPTGLAYGIIDRVSLPLEAEAVRRSIARARSEIFSRKAAELSYLLNCYSLESALGPDSGVLTEPVDGSATAQADDDILPADLGSVLYLQADRNYVRVHTISGSYEVRETMNHVSSLLHPENFVRIHRSVIINLARLKDVVWFNDLPVSAILEGGARMRIGPNYRGTFRQVVPRQVA